MRISNLIIQLAICLCLVACQQKPDAPSVSLIYPTADTLPENLLRMYIQFSQPMKTVGNLENIQLLNDNGEAIEGAIFNNVYELWDDQQQQLTLILDPARVKTGLLAHNALGRALSPGQSYSLVVEHLEDINHQPMKKSFSKQFYVTQADTSAPDINDWTLTPPKAKSQQALQINFPDILDQQSLQSRIIVTNRKEEQITGRIQLGWQEKSWEFTPDKPWEHETYFLFINTRLEDPAGNNLNGLFDHKKGSLKYESEGEWIKLDFSTL